MNNRQFLLTAMFFLLVITGYNQFVALPRARAAQQAAQAQLQQERLHAATPAAVVGAEGLTQTAVSSKPEELTTLSLPHADVTFSSKGAGIKTYLYKDILGPVNLTPYQGKGYFATLPNVDFVEFARTHDSITFTGEIVPGVNVQKTYRLHENGLAELTLTFDNRTAQTVTLADWQFNFGPGLATVKSEMKDNERESKAVYLVQEDGKKNPTLETFTKNEKQPTLPWQWAGLENRYFLAVLVPQDFTPGQLTTQRPVVDKVKTFWSSLGLSSGEVKGPELQITVPGSALEAGNSKTYSSHFYFGPKDYKLFQTPQFAPYHFERSIAFGFFGALGKIARNVLELFYKWTGNYGVAIIMITILLQLILCRFTIMQLKSAAQMKKIQPEVKRIQEKYKSDPATLQRETLALYQKYHVNPLMGCLPLLIQLPIFLALFNALRTSWALHGAKFVWWLTDLSAKDPYYILPILMGVVMFFQQRGNIPPGTDPAQAAMFKYMPLIFTLLFMNFPSGLVLYWLTNSLLTYGIQTLVNKKLIKAN